MATCPRGHESATFDYCDQCGAPMGGTAANGSAAAVSAGSGSAPAAQPGGPAPTAPPAAAGRPCPVCGTSQAGRFCEEDGYDFLLAPPVTPSSPGSPVAAGVPAEVSSRPAPAEVSSAPAPDAVEETATVPLVVVVGADRGYFDAVIGLGGEDAGGLTFPPFVAERRFRLEGRQLLVGRASRSRGVYPEIDLGNPPEDPGVSHTHALLVARPDGWAVVDLASANGTYVNDPESQPIPANTPVPLAAGDRVFVGAWTCLSIHPAD
jgi:hypothetical protein